MKRILIPILIAVCTTAQAQYSNYYNVDVNANIKKDVNVTGNIYEHKTITTIDYGALQLANSQRERNRLESIKYADERQRAYSLEIASDPVKAYDYGTPLTSALESDVAKKRGFNVGTFLNTKTVIISYQVPNTCLFVKAGAGRYENVSADGVTTELIFNGPTNNKTKIDFDVEKLARMDSVKVGELNHNMGSEGQSIFIHKKDIRRATVFGIKGFCGTLIWEDNYQYTITDNYASYDKNKADGILNSVKVRFYGDKDKVTFEQLEGRKYYLKQLIEKVISTASVTIKSDNLFK